MTEPEPIFCRSRCKRPCLHVCSVHESLNWQWTQVRGHHAASGRLFYYDELLCTPCYEQRQAKKARRLK